MRLNQDLVSVLRALEGRVNDADKKMINQVLHNVRPTTASRISAT